MDPTQHSDPTLTVQVVRNGEALPCQQLSTAGKKLIKIGRWPASDIRVDDPVTAHLHAVLEISRFGVTLRDMGSGHPVVLNGEPVTGKASLTGRDQLRIGDTVVHLTAGGAAQLPAIGGHQGANAVASDPWQQPMARPPPLAAGGPPPLTRTPAATAPPPVATTTPPPVVTGTGAPLSAAASGGVDQRRLFLLQRIAALPDAQLLHVEHLLERLALESPPAPTGPGAQPGSPPPARPAKEKYDTRHIVRQMKHEQRLGRLAAGIGMLVVALLIVVPLSLTLGNTTWSNAEQDAPQAEQQVTTAQPNDAARSETRAAALPPEDQGTSPADVSAAASYDEYTVRPGDTLGGIARRRLGRPDRWEAIFAANRDRVAIPACIEVGTRLRIPRR